MGIRNLWRRFLGLPVKPPPLVTHEHFSPEKRALINYVAAHLREHGSFQDFQYDSNAPITENRELWERIRDYVAKEYPEHINPVTVTVETGIGHAWVVWDKPRSSYSETPKPSKKQESSKNSSGDDVIYSGSSSAQTAIDIAIDMSI